MQAVVSDEVGMAYPLLSDDIPLGFPVQWDASAPPMGSIPGVQRTPSGKSVNATCSKCGKGYHSSSHKSRLCPQCRPVRAPGSKPLSRSRSSRSSRTPSAEPKTCCACHACTCPCHKEAEKPEAAAAAAEAPKKTKENLDGLVKGRVIAAQGHWIFTDAAGNTMEARRSWLGGRRVIFGDNGSFRTSRLSHWTSSAQRGEANASANNTEWDLSDATGKRLTFLSRVSMGGPRRYVLVLRGDQGSEKFEQNQQLARKIVFREKSAQPEKVPDGAPVFMHREATWNAKSQAWMLNFFMTGSEVVASVRNFILEGAEGNTIFQLVKGSKPKGCLHLIYEPAVLDPLDAFLLCVASDSHKLFE
eukprot:CAMPEP_0175886646 /NCGR_PEP_ID=MMETSP0107_2-20121207/45743_1 /TAXON_ID=195067 ORGANISM="Goniomonas pacifica, Strain CCMP1869" /NCGR_SAMPLE_ID=MMETSP0107_2 /ASSEMBLY_ACC=CAM_ASM_000203 /LENGTH=358 /DNA_ID=CAMNT_0017207033 /DNA_START=6 /DNA_END=1082 /DNA_ORIENTATION=-